MIDQDVFDRFSKSLRDSMGTPSGQTAEIVEQNLRQRYSNVFKAIDNYSRILNYQDNEYYLEWKIGAINRSQYTMNFDMQINGPTGVVSCPFRTSQDGIKALAGYMQTAAHNGGDTWSKDEIDDFVERLGFAVLHAIGVKV